MVFVRSQDGKKLENTAGVIIEALKVSTWEILVGDAGHFNSFASYKSEEEAMAAIEWMEDKINRMKGENGVIRFPSQEELEVLGRC